MLTEKSIFNGKSGDTTSPLWIVSAIGDVTLSMNLLFLQMLTSLYFIIVWSCWKVHSILHLTGLNQLRIKRFLYFITFLASTYRTTFSMRVPSSYTRMPRKVTWIVSRTAYQSLKMCVENKIFCFAIHLNCYYVRVLDSVDTFSSQKIYIRQDFLLTVLYAGKGEGKHQCFVRSLWYINRL